MNLWVTSQCLFGSPSFSLLILTLVYGVRNAQTSTSLSKFHVEPRAGSPGHCMTIAGPSPKLSVLTWCVMNQVR